MQTVSRKTLQLILLYKKLIVKFCEMDPRCQFHQYSLSSFCVNRSQKMSKKADNSQVFFGLLGSAHRMLMKLSPGRCLCAKKAEGKRRKDKLLFYCDLESILWNNFSLKKSLKVVLNSSPVHYSIEIILRYCYDLNCGNALSRNLRLI